MIVAILPDTDNETVSKALIAQGFRVTTIASTGGLLSSGTSTVIIGAQDEQVETALGIVKDNCVPATDPEIKRGSLFVLNIARFEQI
ncbi:MAG: hypothetical protein HC806_04755 [Anaerolineae bacterium]|nr:hypothetical protein [Anaerolineae bacterium]